MAVHMYAAALLSLKCFCLFVLYVCLSISDSTYNCKDLKEPDVLLQIGFLIQNYYNDRCILKETGSPWRRERR